MITDVYFLVAAVFAQILNLTVELVIPIGMPTNEANTEFETQPLTAQTKKENDENNFKSYKIFCAFHSLNQYPLFLLKDGFLFHLFF